MNGNIPLLVISFIYVLVLSLVYFFKRKYNFVESKIYKHLLIITMLVLVFNVLRFYYGINQNDDMVMIFAKMQGISLFIWLILFAFYALLARSNNKYESFKELMKGHSTLYLWVIIAIVLFIGLIVLQFWSNFLSISNYDDRVSLIYILGIVIAIIILINLLFNNQQVEKYKNYALLVSVLLLLVMIFAQIMYINIINYF
jgi:hypothetical protein